MKKIIALTIIVIAIGLNFEGLLSLGDYISYSVSLVKNEEISVIEAMEYEDSEFNDYDDAKSLQSLKGHIDNILHRSSNNPVNKIVYKKLLGDIYGDLNFEYFNGKLKISPSSWGVNGKRMPVKILEKLDERDVFWTNQDDLYKMCILHLSAGHSEQAYEYIKKANELEQKEEFKLVMAIILSDMKNFEKSNEILDQIEVFEGVSNQIYIYNSIVQGDFDRLDNLTDYVHKKRSMKKDEYEAHLRNLVYRNNFRNQYLKMFDSISDFNREYLISIYNFDSNKTYKIRGHIFIDGKPLKNTMIQVGNHDYFSSMHLDKNSYVGYTNEKGEFQIYVPEKLNYRITVSPNLSDVKGKMCKMPRFVMPSEEDYKVEFLKNNFDFKVIDKGEELEISWNDIEYFDSYTVMIGSMKNGHPYNPEYYSESIEANSITISKKKILENSYSRSYSRGDDGRSPNSFFPVLLLKGQYFIDVRGNIDDSSIVQMDSDINGLYGVDKTFKLIVDEDIAVADRLFLDRKYSEAFSEYERHAANGDIHSISMLANIYSYEDKLSGMDDSPYDSDKAIKYLKMEDEYRYNKYGKSIDDYKLYRVYKNQDNLQGFIDYMNRFDGRYGYEYSDALFHLGKYSEAYEKLLEYIQSGEDEWLVKHLVESGLFYIDVDRIKVDLKTLNNDKYLVLIEGLESIDKDDSKEYQEVIKNLGIKNVDEILLGSTDTGKLYRLLLRTYNGPYSSSDLDDLINTIDDEKIRILGQYLTN